MNSKSIQIINLSVDDLSKLIKGCISEQLNSIKELTGSEPIKTEKEILSVDEVKNLLGLSKTTLWKYRKDGTLTAKKVGSRIYYSRTELFNFLNNAA